MSRPLQGEHRAVTRFPRHPPIPLPYTSLRDDLKPLYRSRGEVRFKKIDFVVLTPNTPSPPGRIRGLEKSTHPLPSTRPTICDGGLDHDRTLAHYVDNRPTTLSQMH